jgi:hypothetical protein
MKKWRPPKSSVPRPPQELNGFAKVRLQPGEQRQVEIALPASALAVEQNFK